MNTFVKVVKNHMPPEVPKELCGYVMDGISVAGPDGLMFEVQLTCFEHELFTPNGDRIRKKIEKFFETIMD